MTIPSQDRPAESVPWRRSFRGVDRAAVGVGALALVLGIGFVVVDLVYNSGKLMAPIDDVYIHLQYGSQIGRGHFLQWNTGDPISTGASSLLYVLILGAAYAVGFQGHWLQPFAVGFGIVCFAVASMGVCLLGRRLVSRTVGLWAGVLVAVSGPVLWGATSGMEVGLASMLFVLSVLLFVRETDFGRFRWTPVVAALLALTRIEGLIFDVALCAAMLWIVAGPVRRREITVGVGLRRAAWTLLPLAFGAAELLFFKLATGTFSANGIQAKSIFQVNPVTYPTEAVEQTIANLRNLVELFGGLSNRDFAMPGAIFFFALGLAYLAGAAPRRRPLAMALGLGFVVVFTATATLTSSQVHHFRYLQPLLPLFLLLVVIGVHAVTRVVPHQRARRTALHGVLAIALLFSLIMLPVWATRTGRESATIRDTDVSVGNWVRGNLPPNAIVAVKDVGAVTYFGGHRVIDMIGLTTDNFAPASNNGPGSLYEALRHLPPNQRPDYVVSYDTGPGPSMADLRAAGVLGAGSLATFYVTSPATDNSLAVPFRTIEAYRADWTLAGTGDQQQVPGQLRDYVNVGDLTSEQAHGYQTEAANVGFQPDTTVRRVGQVVDSGRQIMGGERFTATNLEPGRPLTITSRADQTGGVPQMTVLVNGRPIGLWSRDRVTGGWGVYRFTIPGNVITGPTARIELAPPRPLLNPYPWYLSFGYWLSQ
ncbi:MAG TPA: hypothetical protein VG317_00575 [Pseudonocardiaceae bacterium]|nr:hypothetical protein [Pseudonocardiaceae bacterium]